MKISTTHISAKIQRKNLNLIHC